MTAEKTPSGVLKKGHRRRGVPASAGREQARTSPGDCGWIEAGGLEKPFAVMRVHSNRRGPPGPTRVHVNPFQSSF
jgi:hypothetical protein